MGNELTLIGTITVGSPPEFFIQPNAREAKESALTASALIGKVSNAEENREAVAAMQRLKSLSSSFESQRKRLTEPLLEAQRKLKRVVDNEREELDRELGRLECLVKDFALEERRRVTEANATNAPDDKPFETTRATGQQNRKVWNIKQINDFQLMRARPDLVRKIEWDIAGIKEILAAGGTLPGVVAEEDLRVSVRGQNQQPIDV